MPENLDRDIIFLSKDEQDRWLKLFMESNLPSRELQILRELGSYTDSSEVLEKLPEKIFLVAKVKYGEISLLDIGTMNLEALNKIYGSELVTLPVRSPYKPGDMSLSQWSKEWASLTDWCTIKNTRVLVVRI